MGAQFEVDIQAQYQHVLDRIAAAARAAGRDPDSIQLVVVTKSQPVELIQAVIEAGARRLGENYAEEAVPKIQTLGASPGLEWHMIGHVQSRKARLVCQYFTCLHSLDSLKLARRLDRFAGEYGRRLPVLLEYNVSGEESKFGWPAWREPHWPALLADVQQVISLPNLEVRGLMAMAPMVADPQAARPYYRHLRRLRDFLRSHSTLGTWEELSMGMSADFEAAIQEGSTLVRIGQAILGPRSE